MKKHTTMIFGDICKSNGTRVPTTPSSWGCSITIDGETRRLSVWADRGWKSDFIDELRRVKNGVVGLVASDGNDDAWVLSSVFCGDLNDKTVWYHQA